MGNRPSYMLLATSLALGMPDAAAAQARPGAGSAREESLTLLQAVDLTLAHHPDLARARAMEESALAEVGVARSDRLPQLAAQTAVTRFEQAMIVAPLHGFDVQSPPTFDETLVQGGLSVGLTVFDGGSGGARVRVAESSAVVSGAEVTGARHGVIASASRAFLDVLSSRRVLEAHGRRMAALQAESRRAQQLFDAGRAARLDLLRVQAALSQGEADGVSVESALDRAEAELARLAGLAPGAIEARPLSPVRRRSDAPPDRSSTLLAARSGNPALVAGAGRLDAARAALSLARSAWLPRVDFSAGYLAFGATGVDFVSEWQTGVRFSYPLFTSGARSGAIRRADASERAATEGLRLTEMEVQRALDRVLSAVDEAEARTRALRKAVEQFDEVVRIERLELDAGSGLQTDYLRAEAELFEAQAQLTRAEHGEITAQIDLARVSGQLSRRWVADELEVEP